MANSPKRYSPFSTPTGAKRFTKDKKYHSKEWLKYRAIFLAHNPKCYCCGVKSNTVDHLIAHKGSDELFYKEDNLIPMCHTCHSTITQLFDRSGIPDTEGKLMWIRNRRIDTETTIKSKVVPWHRSTHH
jgi:5-methylcytosine-specific restriction enzyme A